MYISRQQAQVQQSCIEAWWLKTFAGMAAVHLDQRVEAYRSCCVRGWSAIVAILSPFFSGRPVPLFCFRGT